MPTSNPSTTRTAAAAALLLTAPLWAAGADSGLALFSDSGQCIACHSHLETTRGKDVSIGYAWRGSIMANSGRDPYWLASVRREVMDHPQAQEVIEDECSICHMPAARFVARTRGQPGRAFEHHRAEPSDPALSELARDGVTCTVCHQITGEGLGEPSSYTGGFHIDTAAAGGNRRLFGPHDVDAGHTRIMHSASTFVPEQSGHLAESDVCATCHTLYTDALDAAGNAVGELPEQMPYLEWKHSAYASRRSCQDCHMPVLPDDTPITSVLGQPRPAFNQHVFRGGNAFMLRLLNTHRDELGVEATPAELEASAQRTVAFLQSETAALAVESAARVEGRLEVALRVVNQAGHKLPTAYPSRRVWLHVTVTDADGAVRFESGALNPDGSIAGNDNDADPSRYEPHYDRIESADQVQIYEPILGDRTGAVTTGLLTATTYLKDNRLLPRGFDKATAPDDVAVRGGARDDADFAAAGDRIVYAVGVGDAAGPLQVRAELRYQPIGYRWATNLEGYATADEPRRFTRYYRGAAAESAVTLASTTRRTEGTTP